MSLPLPAGPHVPAPIAFVGDAIAALAETSLIAVVTIPAPLAPLEAILSVARGRPTLLWDPPEGPGFSGVGQAVELRARGPRRVAEIKAGARALWPAIEHIKHPDLTAGDDALGARIEPRLFGGFAFAEGAAESPPWDDFGDAYFFLPRWCYGRDRDRAWLSLALNTGDTANTGDDAGTGDAVARRRRPLSLAQAAALRRQVEAELVEISALLADPAPTPTRRPAVRSVRELDRDQWSRGIDDIRAAIAADRCEKVVAARCSELSLADSIDPAAVLGRLGHRAPDCYRFGFGLGAATFVGATPEQLVARAGDRVHTQALAGSLAVRPATSDTPSPNPLSARAADTALADAALPGPSAPLGHAAQALLASAKDRGEQALVVRAIEDALAPLCSALTVPQAPRIRALRHVLHLETPIAGTLAQPIHILELVAALHPTPAVGGVPTAQAVTWIAHNEASPRGWYAGPVGWFDRDGDGEFAVAIRSGLLADQRAYLYAGAGIVRDSDPAAEYEETRIKLRTVGDALGVDG
ncbi:MAG: hypothetical protein Tsb0020_48390 [Haliangiales bacterium]